MSHYGRLMRDLANYEAFLASSPRSSERDRVRDRLIAMLFENGLPNLALAHADRALDELAAGGVPEANRARACSETFAELDSTALDDDSVRELWTAPCALRFSDAAE